MTLARFDVPHSNPSPTIDVSSPFTVKSVRSGWLSPEDFFQILAKCGANLATSEQDWIMEHYAARNGDRVNYVPFLEAIFTAHAEAQQRNVPIPERTASRPPDLHPTRASPRRPSTAPTKATRLGRRPSGPRGGMVHDSELAATTISHHF